MPAYVGPLSARNPPTAKLIANRDGDLHSGQVLANACATIGIDPTGRVQGLVPHEWLELTPEERRRAVAAGIEQISYQRQQLALLEIRDHYRSHWGPLRMNPTPKVAS